VIAFDVLTAPAHVVLPIALGDDSEQRQRLSIGGWYHKVA
jgi:Rps23 Pro-64 3,4-dihydroxylase Tpa1-like proline 4-hydroxylase